MDIDRLKQILTLVREHGLSELEIEQAGTRIRVRRESPGAAPSATVQAVQTSTPAAATAAPAAVAAPTAIGGNMADDEIELAVVKSPIVGTFYRSAEPGAAPFVEIGSAVKKGQVLCIIEAMKLMNEIDSEYDGDIVNVYVENGQPVQYGERLFAIRAR
jgi:acetyl-CoA carboxylase biotin carboxyl carrier protein